MDIWGFPLDHLLLATVVVFGASLVKGTTGFAFALVSAPFLILILDPKLVVAINIPIYLAIDALILSQIWRRLDLKRILPMIVAGAAGVPLGNLLILTISSDTLRVIVLFVVVVSSLILLTGYSVRIASERLAGAFAGFLSGILYSSTSIAGPPIVLFMVNQRWERDTFRASFVAVSACLATLTLVSFSISGVIGPRSLGLNLLLLPVVLLGFYLSTKVVTRLNPVLFRKVVIYLVLLSGIMGLALHFVR